MIFLMEQSIKPKAESLKRKADAWIKRFVNKIKSNPKPDILKFSYLLYALRFRP
jgi:hypothetical protein